MVSRKLLPAGLQLPEALRRVGSTFIAQVLVRALAVDDLL